MDLKPFEVKGEAPEWQLVFNVLKSKTHGQIATYEEFTEALGRDIRDSRGPLYKAARELLEEHKRALEAVQNVGYRVVESNEQDRLAKGQHQKARNRIKQGVRLLTHADRSRLTPEERQRFDSLELTVRSHADAIKRLDRRQERVEKAVAKVSRTVEIDQAERLARLEEALRRSGQEI